MKPSEILIVGGKGQLGLALRAQYPEAQWVDREELDITDKDAVARFNWSGIRIIINAAAYTNVDGAETAEGRLLAWAINADAVANLVAVAAQHDCTIVHISTDYVFDGTQSLHTEEEAFSPLSVYGASKAAGDLVVSLAPRFYLLRTSWVIGDGKNFVRTMLSVAEKGINPTVVHDQIGRLTFTSTLVGAIHHLLANECAYGTYNVTNDGESASWADITRQIYNLCGLENTVTNTTTADYFAGKDGIAPRPLQSTLELSKIKATGYQLASWQDGLQTYLEEESRI